MPRIRVDLDEISGNPRLPVGDYLARLISVRVRKTVRGRRMWVWRWKIVVGAFRGVYIKSVTFLTHPSRTLQNHLKAFGKDDTTQVDTDEFIGRKACLMIGEVTTYSGTKCSSVEAVIQRAAFRRH